MPDQTNRRPFASGSKPGPDEIDHYLEEKGFYRKHVARDASSLFRVVSEQVFDIQNYHDKVRQDCASFMELHIKDYANEVDKNFYNYISNLRKSRTYGTLLELRVIARMYRRNVILFEPNQNLEILIRDFIKDDDYNDKEPIRVFYSHKDKHFDTIYTMETVEVLADCQAIVYEIIYKDVFKLPDVKYAVERMLHDQEEECTLPLEDDPNKYKVASGEIYEFDSHENTNCVLKDPRTCHFHNQVDFYEVVEENKNAITIINRGDDPGKLKIFKPVDGFLHGKDKSCVRQLLDEKITPFPYKVAKSLDPSIYRNTEFELWSENRKEQRLKWFDTNGLPLKDNDDRFLGCYGDCDKSRRHEIFGNIMQKFPFDTPLINEDFITLDEDGKKKYIMDDFKRHDLINHLTSFEHFTPPKGSLNPITMPVNIHHNNHRNFRNNNRRNHRGFHHHNNNHHHQGMNYVADIERDNYHYHEQDQMYSPQQPIYQEMPGNYQYYQYDQNSPPNAVYQPHPQYLPTSPYHQPISAVPYQGQVVPYAYPPPTLVSYPPPPQPPGNISNVSNVSNNNISGSEIRDNSRDSLNLIRDAELSSQINWSPIESTDPNGSDLPTNDVATLQFYYNLGVRYFIASGVSRRLETVANQLDVLDINQGGDQNAKKTDPPPVPVNTPVSTKPPNIGHSGHRFQHNNNNYNNNNNQRRTFNQNSQSNGSSKDNKSRSQHAQQQRKEIQFNSNVKNVHKADNKAAQASTGSGSASSSNNTNIERTSSALTTSPSVGVISNLQYSPIASQPQDQAQPANSYVEQQVQQISTMQTQTQYYQQYPAQNIIQQPTQPIFCYQMENGEIMPLTHAVQPVYYGYSTPQTPMYYQAQQPQILDGTLNSTDSGVVDIPAYATYQQQPYPIIYQPSTPIYYPQTPLHITTPHVATAPQMASIFPVTTQTIQQQTAIVQQEVLPTNDTISTALNDTANTNATN